MEGTAVFDMIEREMWSHIVAAEGGIIYNRERGGMGFIATISYSESGKGEAAKPMSSVATPEEPHLWIKTTLWIEPKQRNEKLCYGVLWESNYQYNEHGFHAS